MARCISCPYDASRSPTEPPIALQNSAREDLFSGTEAFIDEEMTDHFARVLLAGAVVTIVKHGQVVVSEGYGQAGAGVSGRRGRFLLSPLSRLAALIGRGALGHLLG